MTGVSWGTLQDLMQQAAQVQAAADQTLTQLCDWVQREHGVRVGITTMCKTLGRLGLSFKKRPYTPASKSAPM